MSEVVAPVASGFSLVIGDKPLYGKFRVTLVQVDSEGKRDPVPLLADKVEPIESGVEAFLRMACKKCPRLKKEASKQEEFRQQLLGLSLRLTMPAREADVPEVGDDGLRNIRVNNRALRHVVGDIIRELNARSVPPTTFTRGGSLVRVQSQSIKDQSGNPYQRHVIEAIDEDVMRGLIARAANFVEGGTHVDPPKYAVRDVLRMGEWEVPPIEAITETPVLRPDGSILQAEGYDAATGLYYVASPGLVVPPVPPEPTEGDVASALAYVEQPFAQFPFDSDASRANHFALLVTLVIRQAIDSVAPICVVDAPTPGTGKAKLVNTDHIIATGQNAPTGVVPEKEEEFEKRITADLLDGSTFVLLDNVVKPLQSPSLAAALTQSIWKGRKLGLSQTAQLPNRATWVATGNNIVLAGDLPRRAYRVRLDSGLANPELRTAFRIPNLELWVRQNRGRLLSSLLTLCRAWYVAGLPGANHPVLGSFESWCRTVGGILAFAGVEGFLADIQSKPPVDETAVQWATFYESWQEESSSAVTVNEVVTRLRNSDGFKAVLPQDLATRLSDGWDQFGQTLGIELRKRVDRPFGAGAFCVKRAGTAGHAKVGKWQVVSLRGVRGPAGTSDSDTCAENISSAEENVLTDGWSVGESPPPPATGRRVKVVV